MNSPVNQTAEVLYELINNDSISRKEIFVSTGVLNVTARIADLRIRYGLSIECEKVHTSNKFSRLVSYGSWSIKGSDNIIKARSTYDRINQR